MAQTRTILLRVMEERLIRLLLERGFEQRALTERERRSRDMRLAFPFGYMRRIKGHEFELLEVQLDKHSKAKFVLNFGVAPHGVDLPWGHFDQNEVHVAGLLESYRLYSCRGCMRWFSPPWIALPFDLESRIVKAVDRAIELYPEVEAWFAKRLVGPHMRRIGYPVLPQQGPRG